MRLGQLSRKVNVKPSDILDYLKNEFDVELGSHLNTKVDDALVIKVEDKFSPSNAQEIAPINESSVHVEVENNGIEEEVKHEPEVDQETIPAVQEFEPGEQVDQDIIANAEVIKAPKIELEGPKVVGKIELPPSLEEQMIEVDGVMMSKAALIERKKEEKRQKREKREQRKGRKSTDSKPSRIKSEEQLIQIRRDKESEERARKLELREKRIQQQLKEAAKTKKKTEFVPKKQKKKVSKPVIERPVTKHEASTPSTWYGKLWKWFNT